MNVDSYENKPKLPIIERISKKKIPFLVGENETSGKPDSTDKELHNVNKIYIEIAAHDTCHE
jgi:hypothetical protein